ncbi:MAG: amidohydrolase, partial [Chitinophagales bacterium]|nr:amidohydrolase [Chitinophagales bacterium]
MKKILYLLVAALLCHSALAQQPETFPVNGTYDQRDGLYAFTNATIYTNYNKKIEKATLLIQNGKVVQVGTAVTIPKNAVKIDLKGKFIYPAFIDLYTNYGLPETKSKEKRDGNPQMEADKKGAYGWNEAIRPET